jgi:hypothetical protein
VAWNKLVPVRHNPLTTLHIKLNTTAKALRKWSRNLTSQGKLAMAICREVVAQLDKAQENRVLSSAERNLIKDLKMRILGLTAIEKSKARQRSRLTWLRLGDANTKYFRLMASARRKKNFIHALRSGNGVALSQAAKHEVIHQHVLQHTGTYVPRQCNLNFSQLGWEPRQLDHLEAPFSEEEVRNVIVSAPKKKAPGADGFIGLFFFAC